MFFVMCLLDLEVSSNKDKIINKFTHIDKEYILV